MRYQVSGRPSKGRMLHDGRSKECVRSGLFLEMTDVGTDQLLRCNPGLDLTAFCAVHRKARATSTQCVKIHSLVDETRKAKNTRQANGGPERMAVIVEPDCPARHVIRATEVTLQKCRKDMTHLPWSVATDRTAAGPPTLQPKMTNRFAETSGIAPAPHCLRP
jgi:hypothetical protein